MPNALERPAQPKIAIIDDHELLLDGLTTWIRTNATDLNVVLSVTGWFDLIRDPAFPPDATIMDLQIVEPISIESRIRTCLAAGSKVIVISAVDTAEMRTRALTAGASALVSKSQPAEEVVSAVRQALLGNDMTISPTDIEICENAHEPLSLATREALRLYASGKSPMDIAVTMDLPFEHVKNLLAEVRTHYEGSGRAATSKHELILRAAEDGYLV